MPAAAHTSPSPNLLTYQRRDPSAGPLHQLLSARLESYLEARSERPLPRFVTDALHGYLRCGILRHGLARFRCDDCAQSRLLALSCKQRAFCPRCVGRKMADQAKHLVEQVMPPVPYRQWVLSFPHGLRWRMAHDHELTRSVWAIARKAIDGLYRARAANVGPPGHHDSARPGSVMAIQRFGGALNLNVHFHALYTDGSFHERSDGQVVFLPTSPPTVPEIEALVTRIKLRVASLLEKLGLGTDDEDPDQLTLDMGELYAEGVFNKGAKHLRHGAPRGPSPFVRRKAHEDGFDLDAHVSVTAGAREELERLVRYILRPPLKETRLSLHHDGVELTLKTPWRDGTTQIRMSAERFIDRLVALVPRRASTHCSTAASSPPMPAYAPRWWLTAAPALPLASARALRRPASPATPHGPNSCATALAWTSWPAPTAAAACVTWPPSSGTPASSASSSTKASTPRSPAPALLPSVPTSATARRPVGADVPEGGRLFWSTPATPGGAPDTPAKPARHRSVGAPSNARSPIELAAKPPLVPPFLGRQGLHAR
ncbi:MAG: transposase [Sandaracinaceae bacterium]|nr:transposase [Sandaracinaceae bacterium]